MSAAGAAGGGASHTGAVVEVRKVEGALDQFDEIVRKRNAELLGNLQETLKGLSIFEARYFHHDECHARSDEAYFSSWRHAAIFD